MTRVFVLPLYALALVVVGCSPIPQLQLASVGQTGCPADEIVISDLPGGLNTSTWTATCRGHRFLCSQVLTGKGSEYACKEELPAR